MADENTINVVLKVVRKANRTKYDTFSRQNVEMFDNVDELKEFLLSNFSVELSPATTISSFNLGYIAGTNRRVVIANDINLAEAYSVAKAGWITLWAEAIVSSVAASSGTKRSLSHATDDLATNPSGNGIYLTCTSFEKCCLYYNFQLGKVILKYIILQ